eukprot:403331293
MNKRNLNRRILTIYQQQIDNAYGDEDQEQEEQEVEEENPYNEVYVWGDDSHGQLGLCDLFPEKLMTVPKTCSFNVVIKSLSCGLSHTCFVSDQGHIYSMGSNSSGQLGLQDRQILSKNTPTNVESLVEYFICQVSCGSEHTLAISENGVCFAWGLGKFGALGNGRSDSQYEPNLVNFQEPIIDVQAGANHSAFINKNHALFMSGQGSYGQLGLGHEAQGCMFNVVKVRDNVKKVATGEKHTLIISHDTNRVMVSGANDKLQLGLGNMNTDLIIYQFQEIEALRSIQAKEIKCWNFSSVIDTKNNFWVWGMLNDSNASKTLCIRQPEQVPKLKIKSIEIGEQLAVAIDQNSQNAFIIGTNARGELGLMDQTARKSFVLIEEISEKQIELISVGKSGYVVAIGQIYDPNQQEYKEVQVREVSEYPLTTAQDTSQLYNQLKQQKLIEKSQPRKVKQQEKSNLDISSNSINNRSQISTNVIIKPQKAQMDNSQLSSEPRHNRQRQEQKQDNRNIIDQYENQLTNLQRQLSKKDQVLSEYEKQINSLKSQMSQQSQQSQQSADRNRKSSQQYSEFQQKCILLEAENNNLIQKKEVLEKKVESLVKFLEAERRMRHDLEDQVKALSLKEQEDNSKVQQFKSKTEQVEAKEASLKQQIESLVQEQKNMSVSYSEMHKKCEITIEENKSMRAKYELMNQKAANLERENTKLYKQLSEAQQNTSRVRDPNMTQQFEQTQQFNVTSPKISNYQNSNYKSQYEEKERTSIYRPLRQSPPKMAAQQDSNVLQNSQFQNVQSQQSYSLERSQKFAQPNQNQQNQPNKEVLNTFGGDNHNDDLTRSPRFRQQSYSNLNRIPTEQDDEYYKNQQSLISPRAGQVDNNSYVQNQFENTGKGSQFSQSMNRQNEDYQPQRLIPSNNAANSRDSNNIQQHQEGLSSIRKYMNNYQQAENSSHYVTNDHLLRSQQQQLQPRPQTSQLQHSQSKPPMYSPLRSKSPIGRSDQTQEKQVRFTASTHNFENPQFNQFQLQEAAQKENSNLMITPINNKDSGVSYLQNSQRFESSQFNTSDFKPQQQQHQLDQSSYSQRPLAGAPQTPYQNPVRQPFQEQSYQYSQNNNSSYQQSSQLQNVPPQDALGKSTGLLQGIRDKLAMLQKSKHELENKIHNFESKLKDGSCSSSQNQVERDNKANSSTAGYSLQKNIRQY